MNKSPKTFAQKKKKKKSPKTLKTWSHGCLCARCSQPKEQARTLQHLNNEEIDEENSKACFFTQTFTIKDLAAWMSSFLDLFPCILLSAQALEAEL